MSDIFDIWIKKLEYLESLDGKNIIIGKELESDGKRLETPVSGQLRKTGEEAINLHHMKNMVRGEGFPSSGSDEEDKKLADGIVHEYIRDRILKEFNK